MHNNYVCDVLWLWQRILYFSFSFDFCHADVRLCVCGTVIKSVKASVSVPSQHNLSSFLVANPKLNVFLAKSHLHKVSICLAVVLFELGSSFQLTKISKLVVIGAGNEATIFHASLMSQARINWSLLESWEGFLPFSSENSRVTRLLIHGIICVVASKSAHSQCVRATVAGTRETATQLSSVTTRKRLKSGTNWQFALRRGRILVRLSN